MGRLISPDDRLPVSFQSTEPGGEWKPILNVPEYTRQLGMFGVMKIDKKKQLQKGYALNCSTTQFFRFIKYKDYSYSQLEKLDKNTYRVVRRMSVFLWILDGYLTNGKFDNPITAFLNDRFKGTTPFWICHPGTTREAIHYLYNKKNSIEALGFVPHSYKYTDYTFKHRFTHADEVEEWVKVVTPHCEDTNNGLPVFRGFLYNTKNFGISMEPSFINHSDDNDMIYRRKYHDLARKFFANFKISLVSNDLRMVKYLLEEDFSFFVKPDDADFVIYLGPIQGPRDLNIRFMRCILALPLLKKHPKLFNIIEHFGDRVEINE